MMEDSSENLLPRIHVPKEQEPVGDYLQRYTDEELKVILNHPTQSVQLGQTLLIISERQTTETTELETLWKEMKEMKNYGRLKQFVEELRFVRKKLLIALDDYATYIERYTKILSVTRLICSAGDITGSVLGMFMRESTYDYSDLAFKVAAVLGFTGTLSTVTETYLLINASDDIMQQINRDRNLYGPIEEWFQQTERLKQALLNVFPFEKSRKVLEDFSDTVDSEIQGAALLVNFFKKVIETDIRKLRNTGFLNNIICLFSIPDIANLCQLVIYHLNPIHLEIAKMVLPLLTNKSLTHMFYQHIPSLSPCEQNFWSPQVWGRLSFNFMSTLHAFKTLKRSEISTLAYEMRYLRKHLEDQLNKLDEITNFVESKRNNAVNMAPRFAIAEH